MASGRAESQVSIGFGAERAGTERVGNPINPILSPGWTLDNVCCILLYCKTHRRLVVKRTAKGLFLPYITYRSNEAWRKVASSCIKRILERLGSESNCGRGRYSDTEMLDIFRVQWPKTRQFYTRITVLVRMEPEENGKSTGTNKRKKHSSSKSRKTDHNEVEKSKASSTCYCRVSTSSIVWMGGEELVANSHKFLGPEVAIFHKQLQETDAEKFELAKDYADCSVRKCLRLLSSQGTTSARERKAKELLRSAKYNKQAAIRLLNEFVGHCYPSQYMNFNSFRVFMAKLGMNGTEDMQLLPVFRTFNYKRTNYLSFIELLTGLAAMDTTTPNTGVALELRLNYIFRLHNQGGDGKLNLAKLSQLSSDIVAKNKQSEDAESVANMLSNHFSAAISRSAEASLDLDQFVAMVTSNRAVCQLTSLVFRSPTSMLLSIATKFDYGSTSVFANKSVLASITLQARYGKNCQVCRCVHFHILVEASRVSLSGEVSRLINLQQEPLAGAQQAVEANRGKIRFALETKRDDLLELATVMANKLTSLGKQLFTRQQQQQQDANEDAARLWYFASTGQLVDAIKKILVAGKARLQLESKIVSVSSPCFVISGLYGNLKDLLIYGHLLWQTSPQLNKATYLFLGNIIGPQPWSLECLMYLLCMKILTPQRFIILRGMQEVRDKQKATNAFYKNCVDRFETDEIWNLANEVFDLMPIGAVIEDKIFCSSSAFPQTRRSLQSINDTLEKALSSPLKEACVREILSANALDGAATADTFRQFCQENRLCCMIRSHLALIDADSQLVNWGKTFYFNYKAISLYSGSNLKNGDTSSMALVTRNHIRLIRVDTALNT